MSYSLQKGELHRLDNHEVTWAGECPWTDGFCVGTESGNVLLCENSGLGRSFALSENLTEDAINGAAFFDSYAAVSTRSEIVLCHRKPGSKLDVVQRVPSGAHGILATPGGQFLAPMGTAGIFCIEVSEDPSPRAWIEHARDAEHNYYSLRYLSTVEDKPTLVCAARTDGLLTIQLHKQVVDNKIIGLTAPNIDFVDVCSLSSPEWPRAVAALCHDCTLIFIRDVLAYEQPQMLKFNGFRGTPYSILSSQGHVLVLTSREIIVLPQLGSRYLSGEELDRPIHYRHRPVAAVDAFIHDDRELMIITDIGINAFDISDLTNGSRDIIGTKEAPEIVPWDELFEALALKHSVEQAGHVDCKRSFWPQNGFNPIRCMAWSCTILRSQGQI